MASAYFTELEEKGYAEGILKGKIIGRFDTLRDLGWSSDDAIEDIQKKFGLSEAQAIRYFLEFLLTLY